jgi:hypothetical protein
MASLTRAVAAAGQLPSGRPHAAKSHSRHSAPPAGGASAARCWSRRRVRLATNTSQARVSCIRWESPSPSSVSAATRCRLARIASAAARPCLVSVSVRERSSGPGSRMTSPPAASRSTNRTVPEWVRPRIWLSRRIEPLGEKSNNATRAVAAAVSTPAASEPSSCSRSVIPRAATANRLASLNSSATGGGIPPG